MRDRDPVVRLRALEALGRQSPAASFSVVLGALDDDSREIRQQAALLIALIARASPADARLATLVLLERLDDADHLIRLAALRALGSLHDPRAIPALVRMSQEQAIDLRTAAVDALAASGSTASAAAVSMLIGFSRHRPIDELARHADLALGEIATPRRHRRARRPPCARHRFPRRPGWGCFMPARPPSRRWPARSRTVRRPARCWQPGCSAKLVRPAIAGPPPALTAALASPEGATVTLVALDALARLGDPAAVPAIARAAGAPEADLRAQAFEALRAFADPRTAASVEGGLADPEPRVRAAAAALAGCARRARRRPAAGGPARRRRFRGADGGRPSAGPYRRRAAGAHVGGAGGDEGSGPRPGELEALGDALAANVAGADAAALGQAFLAAEPALAGPLARALAAAAHRAPPLADRAVVARAIALLEAAAAPPRPRPTCSPPPACQTVRWPPWRAPSLTPARRSARGSATLSPTRHGAESGWRRWSSLRPSRCRSAPPRPGRRAGSPPRAPALAAAAQAAEGPLAANARAALAGGARGGAGSTAIRLRAPDGAPLAGRWITLAGDGVAVAAMTDETGLAEIDGFAGATAAIWRADRLSLRAEP